MQAIAAILLLAVWFLYFAGAGLWAPFSGDDLMNLHGYLARPFGTLLLDNLRYWSTAYRPLGGLFYATIYRFFGFDPLPFRVACFALLILNLFLLYRVCRRLAGCSEIALLATFLASYHAWFVDLYYSSGTVYDLLCFFFYFTAALPACAAETRRTHPPADRGAPGALSLCPECEGNGGYPAAFPVAL